MTIVVLVVAAVALAGAYLTWTAGRLDRLHARVDAAWAALDAALVRRAAAARVFAGQLPPGPGTAVAEAATQALAADPSRRSEVENELSQALLAAADLAGPPVELAAAGTRVSLARALYNQAVQETTAVRRRVLPRLLHLAGRRELPRPFELTEAELP